MTVRQPDPTAAREEWERAYDEAMRWRDWQTCEILIDERLTSDWYVPDDDASRAVGSRTRNPEVETGS